jgi:hypothetical protein
MPRAVPAKDLDQLVELIARHPEGIGIDGLMSAFGPTTPRRTLQRRLRALVGSGRLVTVGAGRALKYRRPAATGRDQPTPPPGHEHPVVLPTGHEHPVLLPAAHEHPVLPANSVQAQAEAYLPLSPAAAEIRTYVRQPRQLRQPVSYRVDLLESYAPNRVHYLSDQLREHLAAMGRSPAGDAPAGTFARDILSRLLIDLSWASSRLEGNTYSRLDTARLIEFGEAAEGKDALETQMILNHKAAIEYLVREPGHAVVATETIIALHAFLSDGLLPDPLACGRLRRRPVEIGGSVYLPIALPQRIEELFGLVVQMAAEIRDPFEQAFFLLVHLPYLQPFEDVNKRVSRLAANIPLIRDNLSPLSFVDVPEQAYLEGLLGVYELARVDLLRDVFVWAYERSCQQYVAVRRQLVPPDTFRLRYRNALTEAIASIVRGGRRASEDAVRQVMPGVVAEGDRERFVALVLAELTTLHDGNAVRFGLRPLEFAAWKAQQSNGTAP